MASWGPDATWPTVQIIWLCVIVAIKVGVWIMALLAQAACISSPYGLPELTVLRADRVEPAT